MWDCRLAVDFGRELAWRAGMSMRLGILFLMMVLSPIGRAIGFGDEQKLGSPYQEVNTQSLTIRAFSQPMRPWIAADLDRMVKEIRPIFINFALPPKIVVNLRENSVEGADPTGYITYNPSWLKRGLNLEPVFIHEYAHLIFSQIVNLRGVLPAGNDFLQYVENQIGLRTQMESLPRSNIEALDALKREARFLDFENEDNAIRVLSKPYNEFFADLSATLILKDPEAMATIENDPARSFNPFSALPKNYSIELDPHVFFFSSRQLVWSKFASLGLSTTGAQRILRVVYDTAWTEIKVRAFDPRLKDLSKGEIDERFFEALKKAL